MSRILRRHWDVIHLAGPPLVVQKAAMAVFAIVARLMGYPSEYAWYGRESSRVIPTRSAA